MIKKVMIEGCNKDIRKYGFTMRVRKIWNSLPDNVVNAKDVKQFEYELDKFWENQKVKYDDYKAKITLPMPSRYLD